MTALAAPTIWYDTWPSTQTSGVSTTSNTVASHWEEALTHASLPITRESLHKRFRELVNTWHEERGFSSSFTDMVLAPSYQRIISLGHRIVPLIISELRDRPDHWFWALQSITGVNPIPDAAAGNLRLMTRAWLEWARGEGLE